MSVAFQLDPDDDAPAWVTEPAGPCIEWGGWEPEERVSMARPRWTRQQRRIYQRALTVLQRHEALGHHGVWVMLSSAAESNPARMAAHHAQLRRAIERRIGGRLHHFTVRTAEGGNVPEGNRGVLHVLWFWEQPAGQRKRMLWIDQRWLSEEWRRVHGASYVWITPYKPGRSSRHRVSRYVVTQYLQGQDALVRYSWSWRRTFAVAIVALWRTFRNAHGGHHMNEITSAWGRLLAGERVEIGSRVFALPPPS